MFESLNIFELIINNKTYAKISIILFLNKTDLLAEKIKRCEERESEKARERERASESESESERERERERENILRARKQRRAICLFSNCTSCHLKSSKIPPI